MARDLSSGFVDEIEAASLAPVLMIVADFDSGTIRTWTGTGTLSFDGNDYAGVGDLLSIESVEEVSELTQKSVRFVLSGVSTANLSLALTEDYQGRRIEAWFGVLDTDRQIIDAYRIFAGRMDTINIDDSGDTCTISVNAESDLIDLKTNRERKLTDEDQKAHYSSDRFLEFVSKITDIQIPWGVGTK